MFKNKNYNYWDIEKSNKILVTGKSKDISKNYIEQILSNSNDDTSYIVLDKFGNYYKKFKDKFKRNNYNVKLLNINDFINSNKYNPFMLIRKNKVNLDIAIIIKTFYENFSDKVMRDPFFENGEEMLLKALAVYVYETNMYNAEKQTFIEMKNVLSIGRDEFYKAFNDFYSITTNAMFKECWDNLRLLPSKSFNSILIGACFKLDIFSIPQINNLCSANEFNIDDIASSKTIVFLEYSTCDTKFNCILSLFITQTLNILHDKEFNGNSLKRKVRFILEDIELFNITDFVKHMATISPLHSKLIIDIIVNSIDVIEKSYLADDLDVLIDNCDNIITFDSNLNNKCLVINHSGTDLKSRLAPIKVKRNNKDKTKDKYELK